MAQGYSEGVAGKKLFAALWAVATIFLLAGAAQGSDTPGATAGGSPGASAVRRDAGAKSVVIRLRGPISGKTLEQVREGLSRVQGDPLPAGLIVLLDSQGGDGVAAMNIGRLLRERKAHVFVTGQCASACIFVLAAGVMRGAPAYTVGIHRGRLTTKDSRTGATLEVDVAKDASAARELAKYEAMAAAYFSEMGMPPELFEAMQSHRLKGVFRLNDTELTFYGLSGFEVAYFDARARLFESFDGPYRMDGTELARRVGKVASHCAKFDERSAEFVSCYLNVLRDPWLN